MLDSIQPFFDDLVDVRSDMEYKEKFILAQNQRPNIGGIRFVATAIGKSPKLYDQGFWGSLHSCDTPACVAGWTISLLGSVEEFEAFEEAVVEHAKRISYVESPSYISGYASYLLGLRQEISRSIFYTFNWCIEWRNGSSETLEDVYKAYANGNDIEPPTAEEAAVFLNNLADILEEAYGINKNEHFDHNVFVDMASF